MLHRKYQIATIFLLVVLLGTPILAYAEPSTPEIDAKKAEAIAAQAEFNELAVQLELRTEEYAVIAEELQVIRDEITKTRAELKLADSELLDATGLLEDRAAGIYRRGGVELLEVLLGTTSFQDFLTRIDWMRRIGYNDASIIESVKGARERVQQTEESLERREEEQINLRAQANLKKQEMEQAVVRQKSHLENLSDEVAELVAEEEERLRLEAEERARKAAEEVARRAAAARLSTATVNLSELGVGHPEAVGIGLKYLNVPYVWGGSTPAGFDCSGLTQYVYREAGVSIPRTSRSQFRAGSHIPADRLDLLVPGDLVFFGYNGSSDRVHHVGIYAGNGNYLHAPYSGAFVRVDSLYDRIDSRADYVGASRF